MYSRVFVYFTQYVGLFWGDIMRACAGVDEEMVMDRWRCEGEISK